MTHFLNKLGVSWLDVIIFVPFALIYTVFGAFWTTSSAPFMAGDYAATLQQKKDIMYYLLWLCAMGYAIVSNTLALRGKAPMSGIIGFVVMLGAMVAAFFAGTFLADFLRNELNPSTKILSIAINDILVLLPIITGTVFLLIAWIVAGFMNHLPGQPVARGLIRLGVALMLIPVIQFLVIFFLPKWDDEVRGVVFVHAMSLGLLWGFFLGGGVGANLLTRNMKLETA